MKNFDEFKKAVEENFVAYMGMEYNNYHIVMGVTKKVNETLNGFSVAANDNSSYASPVFYVENMYKKYAYDLKCNMSEDVAFDNVMKTYAAYMKEELQRTSLSQDVTMFLKDSELFKENLVLQVVGMDLNKDLLKEVPHRIVYKDLAVVYRVNVEEKKDERFSILISHNIIKKYGINLSEEELYDIAYKNTKMRGTAMVDNLYDAMKEMGLSEEKSAECEHVSNTMYRVRTEPECYSTSLILDPSNFESVAEKLGGDLFIIPSSNMEYLCVLYEEDRIGYTLYMIYEVNKQLYPDEILSYGLYHYDKTNKTIRHVEE